MNRFQQPPPPQQQQPQYPGNVLPIPHCSHWRGVVENEDWDTLENYVYHSTATLLAGYIDTLKLILEVGKFPPKSLVTGIFVKALSLFDTSDVKSHHKYVLVLHSILKTRSLRSLQTYLKFCSGTSLVSVEDMIVACNEAGENSFDFLWGELIEDEIYGSKRLDEISPHTLKKHFQVILEMTTHLLSIFQDMDGLPEHELHRIAMSGSPSVATAIALQLYPSQVREQDLDGNLPLHLVATNGASHVCLQFHGTTLAKMFWRDSRSSLQMLLDAYPEAARIPDRNGRFALNLMLENYPEWEGEHDIRWYHRRNYCRENDIPVFKEEQSSFQSMIESLVEAAPGALGARDAKTHLFPCMLASHCPLDLIFYLVRSQPGVIAQCVHRTEYELYLQGKVESLCNDQRDMRNGLEEQLDKITKERDELRQRLEFLETHDSEQNLNGKRQKMAADAETL